MTKYKLTKADLNFQTKEKPMNQYLPDGFEHMKTARPYLRLSQIPEGDGARIRFVCRPIAGWLDWKDSRPMRFRPNEKPKSPADPAKPIKGFWAVYVWDYGQNGLFVMEITQASVLKSLAALASDPDYGDLTGYDLKFKKEGSGKETRYSVMPLPPKPLGESIKKAIAGSPVRLEALYDGGDPWVDLTASSGQKKAFVKESDADLFDRVSKKLAGEPEKDKVLKAFSDQFKVNGLLDATDDQLLRLEERLDMLKNKREVKV